MDRLDIIENELKEVKKMVMHQDPSPRTIAMFGELNDTIKELNRKMDIIFPTAEEEMKDAQFWKQFFEKLTKGGNAIKWLAAIVAALIILTGYGKAVILGWLGISR